MKLLLDQGLPQSLSRELVGCVEAAVHVSTLGLESEADEQLLGLAGREGWTIVTRDIDFHDLLVLRGLSGPSVIRVVAEGRKAPEIAAAVRQIVLTLGAELEAGCMVTTDLKRVRVRMLPV